MKKKVRLFKPIEVWGREMKFVTLKIIPRSFDVTSQIFYYPLLPLELERLTILVYILKHNPPPSLSIMTDYSEATDQSYNDFTLRCKFHAMRSNFKKKKSVIQILQFAHQVIELLSFKSH